MRERGGEERERGREVGRRDGGEKWGGERGREVGKRDITGLPQCHVGV